MKKEFTLRIDRKAFKEMILGKQDNEGNKSQVVNTIAEKIENTQELYFFDAFMRLCREYNVNYTCFKEKKQIKACII